MKRAIFIAVALLALLTPLISTAGQTHPSGSAQSHSMLDNLRATGDFTQLLQLIEKAGVTDTLSSRTQAVTLFAPEDKTFLTLPKGTLDSLLKDPAKARGFILPFIVSGLFNKGDLLNAASHHIPLRSLAGQPIRLSVEKTKEVLLLEFDPPAPIDPATGKRETGKGWPCCSRIISPDHRTANGFYHTIAFTDGGVWR